MARGEEPPAQGVGHIVAQHPAQRRQHRREALEVDLAVAVERRDRFPKEEIAQQPHEGARILRGNRLRAIGGDIAGEADEAGALAAAIQRPFVAVAVEDVGNARKTPELLAVASAEPPRVRADARRLELDITGESPVAQNGIVGAAEAVGQRRLARADDIRGEQRRGVGHQVLEGRAQPILRRAGRKTGPLGRHRSCELP